MYKCSAQRPGDCQIIPFDKSGTTTARNGQETDNKSGQWLGSLVTSSGEDGTILVKLHILQLPLYIDIIYQYNQFQACAPRYIYYVFMNRQDPVGICFTGKNNFTEFRPFRPCIAPGTVLQP